MVSFLKSSEPPHPSSPISCSLSRLAPTLPATIAPASVAVVLNFRVHPFLSYTVYPAKHFRSSSFRNYSSNHPADDGDFSETIFDDGGGGVVSIKIEKLGKNSRRIISRIGIDDSLQAVWNILTDYERLPDFIPGLALSQILFKTANHTRLFQVGQQNLAFGLKFNAKGTIDCYENDLERLPSGKKRVIKFKMIEGDFELFEGEWSIEQFDKDRCQDDDNLQEQELQTILSYRVDVKPKLLLPVRLLEGRLCDEIKMNLMCIREEVHKARSTTC